MVAHIYVHATAQFDCVEIGIGIGIVTMIRLKAGADPGLMDETGAKPGDVFHDGVGMSQRFEIKKLIRQRYNLMGELLLLY